MANTYTRRINLYINGKEVKNDIASIKAEMNKLVAQQARMTRGSEEYIKASAQIRTLNGIIREHKNELQGTSGMWAKLGKAGDDFNRYFSLFVAFGAALGGILYSGKQAISTFAEFDDKVGDVMKTTGLAKEQVYAMNEELKKINTRSSQMDLMELGRIAGKLGIRGEKDLMGFIRAADKINVALKEDLGGNTEESIRHIGKLVDIFKVKDKFGIEDSLLKVGSAINALGATSTANEQYMVEFTKRVGGIAPQAGVSIQNVIGLAAVLDQLGQTSEVSSTVYSAVISGMYKHTADFAKAAGMDIKAFSNLLKKDANEAFIKLMEGLRGNAGGMEELTARMDGLGLEGKRSIAVLGVLANNTDLLRERQALSNNEFAKGTSLTNEFNIKNETAQAKLEKARKSLANMTVELGQKLMPVLRVSTSGMSYFVKSVSVLTDFFIKHSRAIFTTTAVLIAYGVASKIATLWTTRNTEGTIINTIVTKAKTIATEGAFAATQLYAAAQMLLAGNINGATQAMRVFFATTKLNPIGLAVALITAAVGAFLIFKDGLTATSRAASELWSTLVKQRGEMNNLFDAVKKTGEGTKSRAEGINKINEVYGQYLPNLLTEKSTLNEINTAQLAANASLRDAIVLKSKEKAMQDIIEKSAEKQKDNIALLIDKATSSKGVAAAGLFQSQLMDLIDENNSLDVASAKFKKLAQDYEMKTSDETLATFEKIVSARQDEKKDLSDLDSFYASFMGNRKKDLTLEEQITEKRTALARAETKEQKEEILAEIKLLEKRNTLKKKPKPNTSFNFVPDEKESTKKWSLNDDIAFLQAKEKLNYKFSKGEIATQEELDDLLLALEIEFLGKRIKLGKEKGEELAKLQADLSDKKVKQRQDEMKREKELLDATKEGMSDADKERFAYDQRLIDLKLFGKDLLDMTESELKAYLSLQQAHNDKLNKLDAEAIAKELERKQSAFDTQFESMRANHAEELNKITSFAEAKAILAETMSAKELKKIKTLDQAKKEISKLQQNEEIKLQTDYLKELEKQLSDAMTSSVFDGINLTDSLLSDEEIQVLQDKINEVKKILGGLKTASKDGAGEEAGAKAEKAMSFHTAGKTDILGFTADDWEALYANLAQGKIGVNEITMATTVLMDAWKTYSNFLTAVENKELKKYEQQSTAKKDKLQEQLDAGVISQEAYNAQVKALDADLEAKKEEIANKQAKRDAMLATASIIQNTAAAIMQLWVKPGFPAAIPLSVMVGALGVLQLATVAASYQGAEEGGYLDVVRAQDGKRFKAKHEPNKRGFVNTPTVITGENGSEYIAPAAAVNNPTVRPILDLLEMSRQSGTLATLNLPAVMDATYRMNGRGNGGFVENKTPVVDYQKNTASAPTSIDKEWKEMIKKNIEVMNNLQKKLDDPIKTYVNIHGEKGLAKKLEEYYKLKENASI
ncbi:MAG: phage tail tape measure protein [Bacteroidetes bacterium]|nr:phage tail tape measure protein [Bacteroidota bacterium]